MGPIGNKTCGHVYGHMYGHVPEALDPKPRVRDPTLCTLDPEPSILNPQLTLAAEAYIAVVAAQQCRTMVTT